MSNTVIQIKRSQTTSVPPSLSEGELAYSGNGVSNSLFIGLPDGSNTVTRIAGGKYAFLHNANTGNSTVAVIQGGTLTANAVLITDANSSINELRTAKLIINTSGNTVNEITSISLFANTTQLGANAGGSNTELVTSDAIKTYIDGKTAAIGGALANQQVAFSNGSVFQGSAGLTFDYAANSLSVVNAVSTNTVTLGSNVTLNTSSLTIGGTTVNSTTANVLNVNANNVDATTEVKVGSNVVLTISNITVGNSTVNSFINATGIETDGVLNVANAVTFANGLAMSNTIISNVADPINPNDAANKRYVDSATEGLHIHASVIAATPNTLAVISSGTVTYNNGTDGVGATLTLDTPITAIDNVSLVATNRILVKNEANNAHNGIYVYSNSTVLTRATDFDTAAEIAGGDFTFVTNGYLYNSTGFVQIDEVTTVGTDPIEWVQFSGAGTFTAGDYLYLDGTEFNANANSSSIASVLVARDADGSFSANVISVSTISATNGTFSGPVSGITTLGTGNTTVTGFINVSTSADVVGPLTVTNTAGLGNTTITGFANISSTLAAGNTTVTGFINVSTSADVVGPLTVTNTAGLGNTTITGFANISSTLAAGNTTITGFANISSTLYAGNTTVNGHLDVLGQLNLDGILDVGNTATLGNTTIIGFANISSTLAAGNTTITGFANISSTLAAGNTTITGFANVTSTLAAGNTTITGFANVSQSIAIGTNLSVDGNTTIGTNSSDVLTINSQLASNIIPSSNLVHTLGSSTLRFAEVYSGNVIATNASFGDVSVSGNLTVSGTVTTIDTVNLVVEDPLIKLAKDNESDIVDIGFYGKYANTPNKWTGLFRDASDSGIWKLFSTESQPTDTSIDSSNNTFTLSTLEAYIKSGGLLTNSSSFGLTANGSYSVSITANSIAANVVTVTGASNNSIFYANGSGSLVQLSLGADGKVLQSNGTAVVYGDLDGGTF